MLEAEQVGKYMIRPVLSLERLSFLRPEGKVGYRSSQDGTEQETMDYLEFIARVTSHIPDSPEADVRGGEASAVPLARRLCPHTL